MTEKTMTTEEVWAATAQNLGANTNKIAQGLMNACSILGDDQGIIIVAVPSNLLMDRLKHVRPSILHYLRDLQDDYLDVVFVCHV